LDFLTPHLEGEIPSTQPGLDTASENQQQTISSPQIAPELCKTLIVSESQPHSDSTRTTVTSDIPSVSDNSSVSEPLTVEPLHFTKPVNDLTYNDVLMIL